jgi:polyisoprenoid-binding protein YceI
MLFRGGYFPSDSECFVRKATALAGALLVVSCSALAGQLTVEFDPAKSIIHWTLTGNVHIVHGTFRLREGHVTFDTATSSISGYLAADAASGESGNVIRDKRMQKEILESDRFPEIRLIPTVLEGTLNPTGHSAVRVRGTFQIHGNTHEMTVPIDVVISGGALAGTGKFSIPYVDWGMKDPSRFVFKVDKSVEVEIVAVGRISGR